MATAPKGPKTKYSFADLIDLWVKAGGSMLYAPVAAAIAMAESGGVVDAINANNSNGSIDRGLWQINSIHGKQSTTDPVNNAKAAVAISKGGTDWRPWCVAWSNGRCGGSYMGAGAPVLKHLPAGNNSVGNVPIAGNRPATIPGVPGPGGFVGSLVEALYGGASNTVEGMKQQVTLMIQSLIRAGGYMMLVFTGAAMMIVGLVLLILNTRAVRRVAGFAADVGGQAVVYRAIIPDTPVNVFGAQPATENTASPSSAGSGPGDAVDPWSGQPIAERPALQQPLTPVPQRTGEVTGRSPFDMDATQTTGGTFVARYKRPGTGPLTRRGGMPDQPLEANLGGVGPDFIGGKKGPKAPHKAKHKKRTVIGSKTDGSPFEVTDVSMKTDRPPGRHRRG